MIAHLKIFRNNFYSTFFCALIRMKAVQNLSWCWKLTVFSRPDYPRLLLTLAPIAGNARFSDEKITSAISLPSDWFIPEPFFIRSSKTPYRHAMGAVCIRHGRVMPGRENEDAWGKWRMTKLWDSFIKAGKLAGMSRMSDFRGRSQHQLARDVYKMNVSIISLCSNKVSFDFSCKWSFNYSS